MKTIPVSPRSKSINALLKQAKNSNIILKTTDGREFILAEINDFDREFELTRKNKKLMKFLDKRARETKTVSAAEARARLLGDAKNQGKNKFDIGQSQDFSEEVMKTAQNKKLAKFMGNRRAKNKDKPRRSAEQVRKDLGLK